ncbi:replication initiation protein, partial [Escherichia coli]|uniref:replication initiation protein n=1 Tax=Escherichia coli TaxID=562 RepID=UPI0021BB382F
PGPVFHTIVSIKNDGHYFCRAGGNRPDGLNEPVTVTTHAWLNDRFLLPESQQKNLAELKRSFLDPALKQINEKTPLLAKYSIDDSGKFLFSIIDKQNPV